MGLESAEIYGQIHGTCSYFSGIRDTDAFLEYMQSKIIGAHRYTLYVRGFYRGFSGECRRKYRHMKQTTRKEDDETRTTKITQGAC